MEIWKKIEEAPNIEVSNMGRFRRMAYKYEKIRLGKKVIVEMKAKIRKLSKDNNGYLKLVVSTKQGYKGFVAHRLVAKYFLEDYDENLEVDHINDCRDDNRAVNLKMVSRLENVRKPSTLARIITAIKNVPPEERKRRAQKALETKKQNGTKNGRKKKPVVRLNGNSIEYIEDIYLLDGFNRVSISIACCGKKGKNKTHSYKGYEWYYLEDYEKMLAEQPC